MPLLARGVDGPTRAFRSLGFRLLSAVGHADFTKFIVLSRSRTGSNMLMSLLNSHPEVIAEHEIFARLNGRDAGEVVAKAYAKQPYYVKAKGFKVFYYHPLDGDSAALLHDLAGAKSIRVIHLKLRNILRTLISRKIAGIKDVWAATSEARLDVGRHKATRFTAEELEVGFRRTRDWEVDGDRRFARHPLMSLSYEDLVRDPDSSLAEVLDFLGLQHFPLQTNLRKQNPERLADLVTNYGELKAAFAGTEWEAFFEE
jgi:LPS sulfotransferase NodH